MAVSCSRNVMEAAERFVFGGNNVFLGLDPLVRRRCRRSKVNTSC